VTTETDEQQLDEQQLDETETLVKEELGAETITEAEAEPANVEPETPTEQVDEILQALLGKMTDLDEAPNNLKIMIWGEPDTFKTTVAASAPNNLFIDTEKGNTSLLNFPDKLGKGSKRYPYNTYQGLEILLGYLQRHQPEFEWAKTVTIDTLSNLSKRNLADINEREYNKAPGLVNRYKAETDYHQENNEQMRRLVDQLKDLDRNLILTCHARQVEGKNKVIRYFPDFSERLANTLVSFMDIVIYVEKREIDNEVKRVFRFRTDSNIMTKCRVNSLPDEAVDVTWDGIWNAWLAHVEQAKSNKK
jgi:hypothetical protein